jgi:hypothetical protein
VPRTLVDLAIDASGRAWGLARFDLLARDREVTVTLPAGLRLFGLRADGREVTATPLGGNAWQLRLHDVGWPRSLVAVVAGSVGSGLARGEPIRLEPPRINGLSPAAVVWSLQTPAGLAVRVSEPARVLDDESLDAWNAPAVEQVGQAFAAAIQAGSGSQRSRLDAYAAASRAGAASAGERDWYDAWRGSAEGCLALLILLDQFPRNLWRGRPEPALPGRANRAAAGSAPGVRFRRPSSGPAERCRIPRGSRPRRPGRDGRRHRRRR